MKLMSKIMISCERATELSSISMERSLTFGEKSSLWVHSRICAACRLFRTQLGIIRKAIRSNPDGQFGCVAEKLSPEVKEKISERISKEIA